MLKIMPMVVAGVLIQEIVVGDNDEGNEGGMLPVAMAAILAADGDGDDDMRVVGAAGAGISLWSRIELQMRI